MCGLVPESHEHLFGSSALSNQVMLCIVITNVVVICYGLSLSFWTNLFARSSRQIHKCI